MDNLDNFILQNESLFESVSVIEKELETLNIKMNNFKLIKVVKPISYAVVLIGIVAVITLFISNSVISLSSNNIVAVIILSTFLGAPSTLLVKLYFGELKQ